MAQVFRNRLAADSPYPRLQSNTSSYIQSDSDNNYLWNWVAPTMAAGIISRKISWLRMIPTAARACLPGRSRTPALRPSGSAGPPANEEAKDAYFFVTDLKGSYYYARTLSEHSANCQKQHK
mgnify:FL=1